MTKDTLIGLAIALMCAAQGGAETPARARTNASAPMNVAATARAQTNVAAAQCAPPTGDWGKEVEGLRMKAEARNTENPLLGRILVDVTLWRVPNDDGLFREPRCVAMDNLGPDRQFAIQLTDESGKDVPMSPYGKRVQEMAAKPRADVWFGALFRNRSICLQKGGSAVYHFWLNRIFNIFAPGVYTVTFKFLAMARNTLADVKIESNAATFKVKYGSNPYDSSEFSLAPTITAPGTSEAPSSAPLPSR